MNTGKFFASLYFLLIASSAQAGDTSQVVTSVQRSEYRFAVMDFKTADGLGNEIAGWAALRPQLSNAVADMLATELVKSGRDVLERSRLQDVLSEQDLGRSGRVDPTTAPEFGKVVGAEFLIVGTITEWGMREQSIGGMGNILSGGLASIGNAARFRETTARVKIDYRIVDARTGRVLPGGSGTGQGDDKSRGISLRRDWYKRISFEQKDWTQTQIGKATRKAVQQIAHQLEDFDPARNEKATRAPVTATVAAIISAEEFVIDRGAAQGVRKDDIIEILGVAPVTNSKGEVVFRRERFAGNARIVEVQENASVARWYRHAPGMPALKEGDVARLSPDGVKRR